MSNITGSLCSLNPETPSGNGAFDESFLQLLKPDTTMSLLPSNNASTVLDGPATDTISTIFFGERSRNARHALYA